MITKNGRALALCAIFAGGVLSTSAQPAIAGTVASASAKSETQNPENPKIVPGDVVAITVYPATEYNQEVTVQPDGKVELALLGSLYVKDLTSKELQDLLTNKYSKYVESPTVTINVRHFAGRRVAIIGEVHSPGFYDYRDGMKMLELVDMAGGLNDFAKTTKVTILRAGEPQGVRFNFQAVLDGQTDRDIALRPGDTIYVPKTGVTRAATWMNANLLPWLLLLTSAVSVAILAKQQ